MDALTKKKADRFRYLNLLYERSGGARLKFIDMWELGAELGIGRDDTHTLVDYLVGEHLAEHRGMGGIVGITHHGIVEVERALSEPQRSTEYFPPVVNILNIHSVIGSQIQQGTTGSTQASNIGASEVEAIRALIAGFKTHLPVVALAEAERSEAEAELRTLEVQLGSTKPKAAILRESLKTLRNIVEGVAAGGATELLLHMFAPLVAFIGS